MRAATRLAWPWLLVAGVVVAEACSSKADAIAAPTDASIVGVYALTLVNGGALPFPLAGNDTARLDITGGTITLMADHTFTDVLVTRLVYTSGVPAPVDRSDTLTWTYTLFSRYVALAYPGRGTDTLAVTGDLLQKNEGGLLMAYKK